MTVNHLNASIHKDIPGVGKEIRAFTGLRGVAALDVVISHYNIHATPALNFFAVHNAAVDLFFCLSSFTLCLVYRAGVQSRLDLRNYGAARIARIYPLYLFSLLLIAVTVVRWSTGNYAGYPPHHFLRDGLDQLLLINAWPIVGTGVTWDLPGWSVSIEAFCYLAVFPLVFRFSRGAAGFSPSRRGSLMVLATLTSFFFFAECFDPLIFAWSVPPSTSSWPYWVSIVRGVTMFSAGWLAYLCHLRRDPIAQAASVAVDALTLLIIGLMAAGFLGKLHNQIIVLLFPLLILGLLNERSITARILAAPPLHFLGLISYSLYLLHLPLYNIVQFTYPSIVSTGQIMGIILPLALSASIAAYYLIEVPGRRLLRRWLSVHTPRWSQDVSLNDVASSGSSAAGKRVG